MHDKLNKLSRFLKAAALFAVIPALFATCARDGDPAGRGVDRPVFFSYAWPIAPGSERDFRSIDMQSITVIDVGPDSVSYAPSIRNSYPPDIYPLWHSRGKTLVRRVYDRPFGEDNKKIPLDQVTVEQLVERWSHSMEEPGIDGISIDEFIKEDDFIADVWIEALRTVRERYPGKLIYCWIAGKGLNNPRLHTAIRDYADYCMPEIYYRESVAAGFPDFAFTRFNDAVNTLEKNAPGIREKILLGLGVNENLFDDDPSVDFGDFLEAQVRYIRNDPVLRTIPGLAFYTPVRLSLERMKRLDALLSGWERAGE